MRVAITLRKSPEPKTLSQAEPPPLTAQPLLMAPKAPDLAKQRPPQKLSTLAQTTPTLSL